MSLIQRIESVKMNLLPRFLFFFQSLPTEITKKQFLEWDKMISRFIWLGKKPRIRFKILQLSKENGGMAVPHLRNYFYSAQIKPLINLCNTNYSARWKDIEVCQNHLYWQYWEIKNKKGLYARLKTLG